MSLIAGVDEAGRGAWMGNVVAAAVILPEYYELPYLNDSKKLTPKKREILFELIIDKALAVTYSQVSSPMIDQINIHQATLLAMKNAVMGLSLQPEQVLVDGKFAPVLPYPTQSIVGGDGLEDNISAASIIAKVIRDRQLIALNKVYPDYHFDVHKGYGTQKHLTAIQNHGVLRLHRKSYTPISKMLG